MPSDHAYLNGGNELGRRYITDFARVEAFYSSDYRRPEHLAAQASRLLNRTWKPRFDREAVVEPCTVRKPSLQTIRWFPGCAAAAMGIQSGKTSD